MKHAIMIFIPAVIFCSSLYSQHTVDNVLTAIEKNNTTLLAIRKSIDAEKIRNKTGIYPGNPEAAFNYLWGSPSSMGNRTDINVKQSFDFPTAYSYKNDISDLKNAQAELEYQKQRKSILMQARMVCVELIYRNAMKSELSKRLASAGQIAHAYQSKYDMGDANILEYNKAQVNLLNIAKEMEANEIERSAWLAELARLNGGVNSSLDDSIFMQQPVTNDFEQWYGQTEQANPFLQWIKQEITISRKQKQLNAALNLPRFNAGYMSEKVTGQQFQGITVGISIPLWENKNTVRYAKAQTMAAQSLEADAKLQFHNEMAALHAKAVVLQNSVSDYREKLFAFSNTDLLQKALDKGEISLAEYIFELSVYYESTNKLLEMEKTLNRLFAEIQQYE